ncbi:hypothetical protein ACFPIJ_63985 [Dactylosporangium cerinum]|uniref:Uncharacterized protein n=1 Tax=Dactylosporangium cerinum TaxID=1434730 RepID=A0ABV9WIT8_9ACTN
MRTRWTGGGVVASLLAVAFLIGAEGGAARDPAGVDWPRSRFLLTAGNSGDLTGTAGRGGSPMPWFQVHDTDANGLETLTESVPQPALPAGDAREIVAGPGGVFLVGSTLAEPCVSTLHRFRLTDAGHVTDLAPVPGVVPGMVAGLAMSRDGGRIAYATLPCAPPVSVPGWEPRAEVTRDPAQRPVLTVLDLGTGQRREWTTAPGTALGSLVWAADGRTLGYTLGSITEAEPVTGVTVHALDTGAPGTDAAGGRVLLDLPAYDGTVTSALMDLDGRGGHGTLRRTSPPSTVTFTFTEGRPIRAIDVQEDKPGELSMTVTTWGDGPRYACAGGVDAFGRTALGSSGIGRCSAATDVPG